MANQLSHLSPAEVFFYFQAVSDIPRGSGNTAQIQQYFLDFAQEQGLKSHRDSRGNVILCKEGSPGKETCPPVLIQGHMDIVAVKDQGVLLDLEKEGLELEESQGVLRAKGTSLGADNGIALAYMLALLAQKEGQHPPLECLFTNDEETGLEGAAALDGSLLKSRRMINLDAEEEGVLLTGCAGGVKVESRFPLSLEPATGLAHTLSLTGLTGGHSGMDIHRGRGNANLLLARVLQAVCQAGARLVSLEGGGKDNVIATQAQAQILIPPAQKAAVLACCQTLGETLAQEYTLSDPDLSLDCQETSGEDSQSAGQALTASCQARLLQYISMSPNGVQEFSLSVEGLVETSLNMGIVATRDQCLVVRHAIRSSVKTKLEALALRIESFAQFMGGKTSRGGAYPPWEYALESPLRERMLAVYQAQYQKPMAVEALHAGLECGYLADKISGLDCVAIGPNIYDVHSPRERVEVASVAAVWDYLLAVLAALD